MQTGQIISKLRMQAGLSQTQLADYVFTWVDGNPFHPDSVTSWFRRFIDRNNLPRIHIHSLRHTNASIMIASGIDIKTVSTRLGHSSIQTTGVIYTHQIMSANELASEMIDYAIRAQTASKINTEE